MIELAGETFDGTFPFRPRHLDLGGFRLHYVDEGSGDPVLLVHGDPTWGYLWRAFIPALADTNRVVVPDHMGMGKSGAPEGREPYRLEHHIANLERLVLALGLTRVTLVLHDWGGPVGLGVATRRPELVSRLVLMNTWAHAAWPGAPFPRLVELIRSERGERFVLEKNGYVEAALRGTTLHPERLTETVLGAYLAPFPTPDSRHALLSWSRDIPVGPGDASYAEMARIEASLPLLADRPVLLFWGMQDPVLPPAVLELWRRTYPQAAVCEIAGASHFVQEDAPEAALEAIQTFLRTP